MRPRAEKCQLPQRLEKGYIMCLYQKTQSNRHFSAHLTQFDMNNEIFFYISYSNHEQWLIISVTNNILFLPSL